MFSDYYDMQVTELKWVMAKEHILNVRDLILFKWRGAFYAE